MLQTPIMQPCMPERMPPQACIHAAHRAKLPASPRGCAMAASGLPVKFEMAALKLHGRRDRRQFDKRNERGNGLAGLEAACMLPMPAQPGASSFAKVR